MKIKKIIGTLVMSAVLLTTFSPFVDAKESFNTQNSEIEKDNKALDDLFEKPDYVTQQTINNLPSSLKNRLIEEVGGTFAVKKGIKPMIKNKKTIFFWSKKDKSTWRKIFRKTLG